MLAVSSVSSCIHTLITAVAAEDLLMLWFIETVITWVKKISIVKASLHACLSLKREKYKQVLPQKDTH